MMICFGSAMPPSTTIKIVSVRDPSMEDLPIPVMVDILSRLPVKTIIHCKSVCKKWLTIILDSYFADLQLSRSPTGFMVHHDSRSEKKLRQIFKPGVWKWVEVEDEVDHHHLHLDPVMSFDLNFAAPLQDCGINSVGSVNGFICLRQVGFESADTYICNPITSEYMILPMQSYYRKGHQYAIYSFGVCLVTKEYKVIRIFQGYISSASISASGPSLLEAEVYTLGTGQWRSLGHVPYLFKGFSGLFFNGRAHWIIRDQISTGRICVFDYAGETFELVPSPPSETREKVQFDLGVLKGCLCRSHTYDSKLTVWMMKEYRIKESWHKELVIKRSSYLNDDMFALEPSRVVEGLNDGTLLMLNNRNNLIVYCPRRKIVVDMEIFDGNFNEFAYRPSFHRLHNFENERVHVF